MSAPAFTAFDAGVEILRTASRFLDLHEVQDNAHWSEPTDSQALRQLLMEVGWQEGWPYCASFVEACYVHAYRVLEAPAAVVDLIRARFTPSVMRTFANCGVHAQRRDAIPGSVFFMQKGRTGLGHAGLVILAGRHTICTLEGNTSPGVRDAARDREGDGIYAKVRALSFAPSSGLWLRGFLHPLGLAEATALAQEVGP